MDCYAFGVEQTVKFITDQIEVSSAKILDVGAGRGRLSRRLRALNADVVPIDKSLKAIEFAASEENVVYHGDICDYVGDGSFDAIVFSMSAHHVHPLDKAMTRCSQLLKPGGMMILEEYAVEDADISTARWFYGNIALLACAMKDEPGPDKHKDVINALESWKTQHASNADHHFNDGATIKMSLATHFDIIKLERSPYFYRYFSAKMGALSLSEDLPRRLFELEQHLIALGEIKPLGLRIVAKKKF